MCRCTRYGDGPFACTVVFYGPDDDIPGLGGGGSGCGSGEAGGGGVALDCPPDPCTADQKAIAAEYDDPVEWPCDKFVDKPASGGGGSERHETGYLAPAYKSGRAAVFAYVGARGVADAHVNSDWRCPIGNRAEGGKPSSRHLRGLAGDFDATGFNREIHEIFADAGVAAGRRWHSEYGTGKDASGNPMYTSHIHIDWW